MSKLLFFLLLIFTSLDVVSTELPLMKRQKVFERLAELPDDSYDSFLFTFTFDVLRGVSSFQKSDEYIQSEEDILSSLLRLNELFVLSDYSVKIYQGLATRLQGHLSREYSSVELRKKSFKEILESEQKRVYSELKVEWGEKDSLLYISLYLLYTAELVEIMAEKGKLKLSILENNFQNALSKEMSWSSDQKKRLLLSKSLSLLDLFSSEENLKESTSDSQKEMKSFMRFTRKIFCDQLSELEKNMKAPLSYLGMTHELYESLLNDYEESRSIKLAKSVAQFENQSKERVLEGLLGLFSFVHESKYSLVSKVVRIIVADSNEDLSQVFSLKLSNINKLTDQAQLEVVILIHRLFPHLLLSKKGQALVNRLYALEKNHHTFRLLMIKASLSVEMSSGFHFVKSMSMNDLILDDDETLEALTILKHEILRRQQSSFWEFISSSAERGVKKNNSDMVSAAVELMILDEHFMENKGAGFIFLYLEFLAKNENYQLVSRVIKTLNKRRFFIIDDIHYFRKLEKYGMKKKKEFEKVYEVFSALKEKRDKRDLSLGRVRKCMVMALRFITRS